MPLSPSALAPVDVGGRIYACFRTASGPAKEYADEGLISHA